MSSSATFKRTEFSPQLIARLAGVVYLVTIVTGMFGLGFVQGRLVLETDASATAANILAHESWFRVGFASVLIGTACYVAVTALLYVLLEPVNRSLSLTAAFFSLTGCAIWGVGCVFDLFALGVLKDARDFSQFNPDQIPAFALMFLKLNSQSFAVGMIFFGVYCTLLGYLILRSTFLPRIVGLLVVAAGVGHLFSMFATFLAPASTGFLFPYIMLPGVVGEVGLTLWLLVFGVNSEGWIERAEAILDHSH
jgi:Domain of unknown function (DUF4386)